MLFEDQAIHNCNQTKHRLRLCTNIYALFLSYVVLCVPGAKKKTISIYPDSIQVL